MSADAKNISGDATPITVDTDNGKVSFFLSPGTVFGTSGYQEAKDLLYLQANIQSGPGQISAEPGGSADIIRVVGTIVGATATTASAGTGIAKLINNSATNTLEIEVTNYSSYPIILYNYDPSKSNITKTIKPLLTGGTDTFLLTGSDKFTAGESNIELNFLVDSILFKIIYACNSTNINKRDIYYWMVSSLQVDTMPNPQTVGGDPCLIGTTFQGTPDSNFSKLNFSCYTAGIGKPSGQIDLVFYNTVPQPSSEEE